MDEWMLLGAEYFYSAIRHFQDALPPDFAARARIVLSSRVSEWPPETDGARIREYFDLAAHMEVMELNDEDEDGPSTKPGEDGLLVVQLNPLDREQVARLAQAQGHTRTDNFVTALDRAHDSRHGILMIGMHDGNRHGWAPPTGGRLAYAEVDAFLQAKATELELSHPEVKRLTVVSIDFRPS